MKTDGWRQELTHLINRWPSYEWGVSDCEIPDMEREKGWINAAKFMMRRGWATVEDAMDELLGEKIPVDSAVEGDIILFITQYDKEMHLAVHAGEEALSPGPYGLQVIERTSWIAAWKVR